MSFFTTKEIEDLLNIWELDREKVLSKHEKKKKTKCECGAEKTYGKNAHHSHWCPCWEEV